MLEMECAGEQLLLLAEKAIYWPTQRAIIIADLHLGKSAAFRAAGIAVPETTTTADLARLDAIIELTGSKQLIILGDLLHDRSGWQSAMMLWMENWRLRHSALEVILVPGNHDLKSGSPPRSWNIKVTEDQWPCGPFLFSHKPIEVKNLYVLAGHVHPCVVLRDFYGPNVRAACFYFGKKCGVLPAFGSFTGTSEINPRTGERVFLIGPNQVIEAK